MERSIYDIGSYISLLISVLSTLSAVYGAVLDNILATVGFGLSALSSTALYYSLDTLSTQGRFKKISDDLRKKNIQLNDSVMRLKGIEKNLKDDLNMLKNTIGLVGSNAREMINNLKSVYEQLNKENEVHKRILKSQIQIQLLYLFRHFDCDNNMTLNHDELTKAKAGILALSPNINWSELLDRLKHNEVSVDDILEMV